MVDGGTKGRDLVDVETCGLVDGWRRGVTWVGLARDVTEMII